MKRVGGISIIGPALYYTCHIEFKKKGTDRRGAALYIHKEEYLLSDENHNTDSFSFLLCRRIIIGTPGSFSVGDITNQQLSASCFDVKLCWPATKEKSGPRPITAHKLREEKNQHQEKESRTRNGWKRPVRCDDEVFLFICWVTEAVLADNCRVAMVKPVVVVGECHVYNKEKG